MKQEGELVQRHQSLFLLEMSFDLHTLRNMLHNYQRKSRGQFSKKIKIRKQDWFIIYAMVLLV